MHVSFFHQSMKNRLMKEYLILPFPTDTSQKCYSTGKSGISVRLASTRKWQELFRMVIIPILCRFIPNLFVHNVNCLANLLRGNLSIINCWTYLEISKISLYPPSICGSRLFCLQIFNLAQIDKISKDQTDCFMAFEKMISILM